MGYAPPVDFDPSDCHGAHQGHWSPPVPPLGPMAEVVGPLRLQVGRPENVMHGQTMTADGPCAPTVASTPSLVTGHTRARSRSRQISWISAAPTAENGV